MFHLQIVSEQRLRLACKWLVFSLGPAAVKDTQSPSFLAWKHSLSRRQEWIQHAAARVRLGVARVNRSVALHQTGLTESRDKWNQEPGCEPFIGKHDSPLQLWPFQ